MEINALVEQKISEDTEFQASLEELSDEDKEQAMNEKRSELIKAEFEAIEAKATKAEEIAKNQEIRAKKAEELAKQLKQPIKKEELEPPKKSEEYSLKDIRALNDVHDEDVDKLVSYAKFMGITIAEAKKLPEMEAYRKDAEEKRKTAQATNIKPGGRGASKVSGEDLLDKFNQGDIPEKEEDVKKVIEQRWTPKEK